MFAVILMALALNVTNIRISTSMDFLAAVDVDDNVNETTHARVTTKFNTSTAADFQSSVSFCSSSSPQELTLLQDLDRETLSETTTAIPQVLYQTAKDRCISSAMYNTTIQHWIQKSNLSYRFYDDARMEAYLYDSSRWNELFPALSLALRCIDHVQMPVMKADIWRYLILWEHGGIFADLDVLPVIQSDANGTQTSLLLKQLQGQRLDHDTIATVDDDALFVLVNTAGQQVLSQWLMAVTPRHPLMYYAVEEAAFRVLQAKRAIPIQHTGPRALYDATDRFLNYHAESRQLQINKVYHEFIPAAGDKQQRRYFRVLPSSWAQNNAFQEAKAQAYEMMNMTHYSDQQKASSRKGRPYNGTTCLEFLGGSLQIPSDSTNSKGAAYDYDGTTYSFRNPMPASESYGIT